MSYDQPPLPVEEDEDADIDQTIDVDKDEGPSSLSEIITSELNRKFRYKGKRRPIIVVSEDNVKDKSVFKLINRVKDKDAVAYIPSREPKRPNAFAALESYLDEVEIPHVITLSDLDVATQIIED